MQFLLEFASTFKLSIVFCPGGISFVICVQPNLLHKSYHFGRISIALDICVVKTRIVRK